LEILKVSGNGLVSAKVSNNRSCYQCFWTK